MSTQAQPEIPEVIRMLESYLGEIKSVEARKFIEKQLAEKNIELQQLRSTNQALLVMLGDVWELIQNINSNTTTSMKSIVRILSPILQRGPKPQ